MIGNRTDEELMTLYQKGSEEAFMELYARHSGKIFGYLKAKTRSEAEASDLLQETFLKIHKSKHLYNTSLPALPWIFSVTFSVLMDGFRKKERRKEVFGMDMENLPQDTLEQPVAQTASTIRNLPKQHQIAVQLRYIEEKTFDEIAEQLKTSPANVRQMVSRGVKALKSMIKKGKIHD